MAERIFSRSTPFLQRALLADAVLTGATALLMLLGSGLLATVLSLPEVFLRYAGLFLVPFVGFVAYLATRDKVSAAAMWAVILNNVVWAACWIALLLSGWIAPNTLGVAFVSVYALLVAVFATVQYIGLRGTGSAA